MAVRTYVVGTLVVLLFSGLGIRLVQLHIWDRDRFTPTVQAERIREIEIVPQRGAILAAGDEVIACDRTVATLVCDRRALRDPNLGIRALANRNGRTCDHQFAGENDSSP